MCKCVNNGSSKKKCQLSWSFVFCRTLLLFYSNMVHKQWLKVWFLTSQMLALSGSISFVPFSTTWLLKWRSITGMESMMGCAYWNEGTRRREGVKWIVQWYGSSSNPKESEFWSWQRDVWFIAWCLAGIKYLIVPNLRPGAPFKLKCNIYTLPPD